LVTESDLVSRRSWRESVQAVVSFVSTKRRLSLVAVEGAGREEVGRRSSEMSSEKVS